MKKVLFSVFFMSLLTLGLQAQNPSCSKSCTAKPATGAACEMKSGSASSSSVLGIPNESDAAAVKLASSDPSIESRTCPVSGTVSYVRKETNAQNGAVSYVSVSYDAATNSFVNVSPVKMNEKSSCGDMKATTGGKSCCAAGSSGGACCAAKGKTSSTSKKEKM